MSWLGRSTYVREDLWTHVPSGDAARTARESTLADGRGVVGG